MVKVRFVCSFRARFPAEGKRAFFSKRKYLDFIELYAEVSLSSLGNRLGLKVSDVGEDGEVRTACPKCGKHNSLSFNLNSERFNCFAKSCSFRGGGVIDFFGKLEGVFAKEAAHLLARLFPVEPYSENAKGESDLPYITGPV